MPKAAQSRAPSEVETAREFRESTNAMQAAIADTESEILAHAFSNEPPDHDGDDSLEQMGEGLEGDHLEGDRDDDERGDADDRGDTGEDDRDDRDDDRRREARDERDDRRDDRQDARDQRDQRDDRRREPRRDDDRRDARGDGDDRRRNDDRDIDDRERRRDRSDDRDRGVPPRVFAQERRRSREFERENDVLRDELRRVNQRLDMIMTGGPQQRVPGQDQPVTRTQSRHQQDELRPAPDQFADPEAYNEWVRELNERSYQRAVSDVRSEMARERQQSEESRLNASFQQAATGVRGYEFGIAYNDFRDECERLPKRERDSLLASVVQTNDPGRALLGWWERTSSPEYLEYHRQAVREHYGFENRGGRGRGRDDGYDRSDARRERDSDRGRRRDRFDDRSYDDRYDRREERRFDDRYDDDRGYDDRLDDDRRRSDDRGSRREYRLPPSLNSARGGGRQHDMPDARDMDGSDASILAAAFAR